MVSIVSRSDDEDVPLSKVVPKQESDAGQAADTKQNDTIVQTDNGTREEGSKKKKKKEKKRKAEESGKGVAAGKKAEGDGAQKRVRKVFDKPGQTRETPAEEDPQRRFYTSLLEQNPKSEMAQKWCVMNGLLPVEEAKKWVAKHGKKTSGKSSTSAKKASAGKRSADGKSPANKKKKKKEGSEVEKKKAKKTQKAQYKEEPISGDSDQEIIPKKKKRTPLPEGAARPVGRDAVRFDDEDV